jgi:nucleoid DNA-binding protein
MTKRDLAVKIANKTRMKQSDVVTVIQMTLDEIADELANGGNIELRNFGIFEVVVRKSRIGRNPKMPSTEVTIPERCVVKFRAGKKLKARIEAHNQ